MMSQYRYTGDDRLWVHIKGDPDPSIMRDELAGVLTSGELCVSSFSQFRPDSPDSFGYVFSGKPSYWFPSDVCSFIDKNNERSPDPDGLRYMNTNPSVADEAFLDLGKAKIVGEYDYRDENGNRT